MEELQDALKRINALEDQMRRHKHLGYDLTEKLDTAAASTSPGGNDKAIQFNDNGAFGGDDTFRYDKTAKVFYIGTTTGGAGSRAIATPNRTSGNESSTNLQLATGLAFGSGVAGDITILPGDGGATGNGGGVSIKTGKGGATSGNGGDLLLQAQGAQGDGTGGKVTLRPGEGKNTGVSGDIIATLVYGASSESKGYFQISGTGTSYRNTGEDSTSDATPTVTNDPMRNMPESSSMFVELKVAAVRTAGAAGSAGDSAGYVRRALYKRVGAAAPTLVGSIQDDFTAEDQAGWNATFAVSGNKVVPEFTGATDNDITWEWEMLIICNVFPLT